MKKLRSVYTFLVLTLLFYSQSFLTLAKAETWDVSISKVDKLLTLYSDEYKRRTGHLSPGTAVNGLGYDDHTCAIVGRMLGLEDRVSQFEPPLPSITSASDNELASTIGSLDSWIAVAKSFQKLPRRGKIKTWNLKCATLPGLWDTHIAETNLSEEFYHLSEDGTALIVMGEIKTGFYERFRTAVVSHPKVTTISVLSPGGNVVEALQAGHLIRERKLNTTIGGNCYSACPFIFMAGAQYRIVWGYADRIGFHQIAKNGKAVPNSHDLYDLLYRYFAFMGADADTVLAWVQSASPTEMNVIDHIDLCAANVATAVYHVCLN